MRIVNSLIGNEADYKNSSIEAQLPATVEGTEQATGKGSDEKKKKTECDQIVRLLTAHGLLEIVGDVAHINIHDVAHNPIVCAKLRKILGVAK